MREITFSSNTHGIVLAGLLILFAPLPSSAEIPSSWGSLEPGPYAVGFRVVQEEDRTRGYWPLHDYRGVEREGPRHRPIQISVWYPARSDADDARVTFRDYVALQETALGESQREWLRPQMWKELREEMLGSFFPPDGPDDAELEPIVDQRTFARRDAPALEGCFPVVIHSGFGPFAQSVMLEYLASHGYIVMTTHMLGSSPAWFHRGSGTLEWWEETARDVGFLRAFASNLPQADARRVAVIGMTAHAAVLDQMDSMQLSAIAGTEGRFAHVIGEVSFWEPARIRIPILDIVSQGAMRNEEMLRGLPFSDRWLVRLDEVGHVDFYQFKRLVSATHATEHEGYAATARLTRAFLDAHLREPKGDVPSWSEKRIREITPEAVTILHLPAERAIPSEHEFLLLVRRGEIEEASRAWRDARERGHERFFTADGLRTVAIFRLFDDGDPAGAAAALRILLEAYPNDVDGWRFLSRALQASGDVAGAREALEQAARVVDAGADLSEEERARMMERISQDLERLQ